MFGILVVFAEMYTWSVVCGADVTWTELLPLQNSLHFSDFPNRTTPSSTSCIALGTSTPGCSHVTYVSSTSTCHFHGKLQGRQSIQNSRVWSEEHRCPADFTYREQIGVCIYLSTDSMKWGDAFFDCESRQGRLLVTTTASKIKAVETEITEHAEFWVGGAGSPSRWITGEHVNTSDFTYIPKDDLILIGGCLIFEFVEMSGMVLTDDECGRNFRYICEAVKG